MPGAPAFGNPPTNMAFQTSGGLPTTAPVHSLNLGHFIELLDHYFTRYDFHTSVEITSQTQSTITAPGYDQIAERGLARIFGRNDLPLAILELFESSLRKPEPPSEFRQLICLNIKSGYGVMVGRAVHENAERKSRWLKSICLLSMFTTAFDLVSFGSWSLHSPQRALPGSASYWARRS